MVFQPFHMMIENLLHEKEQGYINHRVVHAGWYQGLFRGLFRPQEKDEKLEQKGSLISP